MAGQFLHAVPPFLASGEMIFLLTVSLCPQGLPLPYKHARILHFGFGTQLDEAISGMASMPNCYSVSRPEPV